MLTTSQKANTFHLQPDGYKWVQNPWLWSCAVYFRSQRSALLFVEVVFKHVVQNFIFVGNGFHIISGIFSSPLDYMVRWWHCRLHGCSIWLSSSELVTFLPLGYKRLMGHCDGWASSMEVCERRMGQHISPFTNNHSWVRVSVTSTLRWNTWRNLRARPHKILKLVP